MAIERKQEIGKGDQAYQVLGKYFGAKNDREAWKTRRKIKRENKERLAKMAGVTTYDEGAAQNTTIADRLRRNDVEPFYNYKDNAAKITHFDEIQKINTSKNLLDQVKMQKYIANLNDAQIAKLNKLSPDEKLFFMAEESKKIQENQKTIVTKIDKNGETNNENLATMKQLKDFNDNMEKFTQKNKLTEYIIDTKAFRFIDTAKQAQFEKSTSFQSITKETNETKKIYIMNAWTQKDIKQTGKYETLSDEAKKEFNLLVVESYTINQNLGENIAGFDMGILYAQAREYLSAQYTNREKEPCHTLTNNITTDPDMITFFQKEENKITTLSKQTATENGKSKDKQYYTQLFLLYPDITILPGTKKPIKEYLQDFNDDMTIKSTATETEKKDMNNVLSYIQKLASPREKILLEKTNNIVQEYAISQCVESLQQYMDIDIESQQNLLEQLKILQNTDAVSSTDGKMILKIQGERDGKKMNLSYDLLTGNVYHHPFLYKESLNEADPLLIENTNNYTEPPLTKLAIISQIFQGAKTTEYSQLIKKSPSITEYKKNIQQAMKNDAFIPDGNDYSLQQDTLRKKIIQDDIVQDIIKMTGKTWGAEQMITSQQQNVHTFYNYLHRSLVYAGMKSLDQLLLFKKNISSLLTYKTTKATQSSFDVMNYKEHKENKQAIQNEEMFVLQSLVNQVNIPQITSQTSDQGPEEKLLSFFKCFEKQISGISIIDGEIMNDFFQASTGTNKKNNAVGKRTRPAAFTKLTGDLATKLGGDLASIDLEQQLDLV